MLKKKKKKAIDEAAARRGGRGEVGKLTWHVGSWNLQDPLARPFILGLGRSSLMQRKTWRRKM